jgi:hypothetical protein
MLFRRIRADTTVAADRQPGRRPAQDRQFHPAPRGRTSMGRAEGGLPRSLAGHRPPPSAAAPVLGHPLPATSRRPPHAASPVSCPMPPQSQLGTRRRTLPPVCPESFMLSGTRADSPSTECAKRHAAVALGCADHPRLCASRPAPSHRTRRPDRRLGER